MNSSYELYTRLFKTIGPMIPVTNIKQLANWLWISVGILQANSVALSKIATYLPGLATAESRVTTIRRWLMNFKVDVGILSPDSRTSIAELALGACHRDLRWRHRL